MSNSNFSRICLLTERDFARHVFRAGCYECQDVLVEIDDVDLISLQPSRAYELRQRYHNKLIWHDPSGLVHQLNFAFQPARLAKNYEIFVAHIPNIQDLSHISAVRGWKDRCEHSVCWINEFWARDIPKYKPWLLVLKEFDHVIFGWSETAKAVSDLLGRECHVVPGGVDALRFSPFPDPPERVVDILSIGRRLDGLHQALLKEAKLRNAFYMYDTFHHASDAQTYDYRQHREMYANMIKRSRFAMVAPGLMDREGEAKGQPMVWALGWRYYESAAAGAIMLGPIFNSETFSQPLREMFDWPDAVIEVQPDGSDVWEKIAKLMTQPERLLGVSRRNAREALLRHDWVYRWRKVFDIIGVSPGPGMAARENKLRKLAEESLTDEIVGASSSVRLKGE